MQCIMNVKVARPDAANLIFRAYGRELHPDLLCAHNSVRLAAQDFELNVLLIPAGHALVFRTRSQVVTELISDRDEAHSGRGRLFEHGFRGTHGETVDFESGLRYDVCCSAEKSSLTVFLRQHEELAGDGAKATLFAEIPGTNRFSPGPLSLVRAEVCRKSVVVHAYHTFPDQLTVIKTQSLFELR